MTNHTMKDVSTIDLQLAVWFLIRLQFVTHNAFFKNLSTLAQIAVL